MLNIDLFKPIAPNRDPFLFDTFIVPEVLPALLNAESTLVAAPSGYGKSTLAWVARQRLQAQWLHVSLDEVDGEDEALTTTLLRRISADMWEYLQMNPAAIGNLQARARAARYFLTRFLDIELDFLLACLADDFPDQARVIHGFRTMEPGELFNETANDTQRLRILCDCVQRLGFQGVIIWVDLSQELKATPLDLLHVLHNFFDSLQMVRHPSLHIKCLALPSVCEDLQRLRGVQTLSVQQLTVRWTQPELQALIDRRLQLLDHLAMQTLEQLVAPEQVGAFLDKFSDVHSPTEWIALVRLLLEQVNDGCEVPLSETTWLNVRRAYCAERVPIWMDEQGSFWRGKQLLTDLNPRKRALYRLMKYLYEHPGVHRTYKLLNELNLDEPNLNTMISRLRKEHVEPFPPTETERDDVWVYLVTDSKGGGYELRNTKRSRGSL